jgi:hypothetical protein
MRSFFILIINFLCISWLSSVVAQPRDTVLNMLLSKPYFYNVIKGGNGKIYSGTAEGIFEIDGLALRQYGRMPGYVTIDKKGNPAIDSTGLRFYKERKYLHLLPYPEMAREEYHAGTDDQFYVCSGGRLYFFDIVPYAYSYPNHSFRTISKDFLGTYSGIYLKGKKMGTPLPNFTDGYIRQYNDRAFICNYNLYIIEKDALESGELIQGQNFFQYQRPSPVFFNDIFPSTDKKGYFLATQDKLIYANNDFTIDTLLFEKTSKQDGPVQLITGNPYYLYFQDNQVLLQYRYENGSIEKALTLNEPIKGGFFADNQLYILTANALYRRNSDQRVERLTDLSQAHSIVKISGSELIISTDIGLFHYNIASKLLSPVIRGVEFNRQALYAEGEKIYAGSVNGLYTIELKDIPKLIEKSNAANNSAATDRYMYLVVFIACVFIGIMGLLLIRSRQKLKSAQRKIEEIQSPRQSLSKEKIEEFISENLSTASIKTLMDHFEVSAPVIYDMLKPDRPGSIIQQLRLETVKKMRQEGKTIDEMAEATGLSISYLRKLKA